MPATISLQSTAMLGEAERLLMLEDAKGFERKGDVMEWINAMRKVFTSFPDVRQKEIVVTKEFWNMLVLFLQSDMQPEFMMFGGVSVVIEDKP